jgi:hypothetical protein
MKEIELTQGKVALVDDEDFDYINQWKWYLAKRGHLSYGVRNYRPTGDRGPHILLLMHRVLLERRGADLTGREIDHVDGDGLNNLRSNLRLATRSENSRNSNKRVTSTSPYKGVTYSARHGQWVAQIHIDGKRMHCGYHHTPEEAASAYNRAAVKYFGEFAKINVGVGQPEQSTEIYVKRFPRKRRNTTSKYRGVSFSKEKQQWVAQIQVRGKTIRGGFYPNEELAALAYNDLVLVHVGDGDPTRLNKICDAQDD